MKVGRYNYWDYKTLLQPIPDGSDNDKKNILLMGIINFKSNTSVFIFIIIRHDPIPSSISISFSCVYDFINSVSTKCKFLILFVSVLQIF